MTVDRILVTAGDVVCVVAFLVALGFVLRIRTEEPLFPRSVKIALAVAMGLMVFIGMSNVLEWLGITAYFDMYEDYAEMLFLPLIAYAVYTLSMARQIDAARRAEAAIRSEHDLLTAIVDTTPAGIVVATRGGDLTFSNDPARALLGILDADDAGGLALVGDMRIGGQRPDWTDMREALADMVTGPSLRDAIRFVMHPDGATVAVSVSTNRLGGSGDEAVIAFQDITERMRYRQDLERTVSERTEELLELNRELERANSAKREFLAKMSHELRTPLNSVIGFTGILIEGMAGPLKPEQLKQLGMVRRSGHQLLDIVNDVLDIARIESGKAVITAEPVDLCTFTQQAVELLRHSAEERAIDLVVECPLEAGVIRTDAGKLGQVLRNLVSNAVKFTDHGGRVTVRAAIADGIATFAVADDGIGIAPGRLDEIFEPFSQIDTPDRMKPQGTGLGLAVSRDLVMLLGGRIAVESEPGTGSTFTVSVPTSPS